MNVINFIKNTKVWNFIKLLFRSRARWKRIGGVSHFSSSDYDYKLADGGFIHAWELAAFLLKCDPDAVIMVNGSFVNRILKHTETRWDGVSYIDLMAPGEERSSVEWAGAKSERI